MKHTCIRNLKPCFEKNEVRSMEWKEQELTKNIIKIMILNTSSYL